MNLSAADAKIVGQAAGDSLGYAIGSAGDLNGDGRSDLLVGAPYNDAGGEQAGAAWTLLDPLFAAIDYDCDGVVDPETP
jgi:hypothetical protein